MAPKTNDATGATIYGNEGIVQAATGRLDQVDPSRTLDGSVIEGFESDERDIEEPREKFEPQTADVAPVLNKEEAELQKERRDAALTAPLSLDGKMSGQEEKKDSTPEQPVSPADSQRGSEVTKGDDSSSDGNNSQTSAKSKRSSKSQ